MKRLILLVLVLTPIVFCAKTFAQSMTGPYKATYSSNFKMGKPALANRILDLWKDWDDNQLDRHDFFSDTVTMMFADGMVMKGKKENLEAAKKYRSGFTKVVSTVHAWLPLTSNDRNEDAVCIWGHEVNTLPDGKEETRDIHEVWWFNKDGKVASMRQWTAKFGM
jgi:hypothetical protein